MINDTKLIRHLIEQRYQILVSVRPLPSARIAWNKALQALIDTYKEESANASSVIGIYEHAANLKMVASLEELFFEITI